MEKQFKQLPLLLRLRLYVAANYENTLETNIRYQHMMYGSVIVKSFNRAWYNPMKYILGPVGKKVMDTKKFFEENPDYFDTSDITIGHNNKDKR